MLPHTKLLILCKAWNYRPGELCYNFCISNNLIQMIPFPTWTLTVLFFWTYLVLLMLVFVISCSPSIRKFSSCFSLSLHWLFFKLKRECPSSSHRLWLFLCWLGQSLWWFERFSTEDIFKPSVFSFGTEFCEWVQAGIDVYIPQL